MPLTTESHDSLPYIDPEPNPQTRSQISTLLTSHLPADHTITPHPSLPTFPSPTFSSLIQAELDRIEAKQPLTAIDTTRYEALEAPSTPTDPRSDEAKPELLNAWNSTLQKAYASSVYLATRQQNLALLERFGKNAWLVGNSQLEDILRGLERELTVAKGEMEGVNRSRKGAQEGVRGEMEGLEAAWRGGVGRVVEVEVAGEGVRRGILERRRGGAR